MSEFSIIKDQDENQICDDPVANEEDPVNLLAEVPQPKETQKEIVPKHTPVVQETNLLKWPLLDRAIAEIKTRSKVDRYDTGMTACNLTFRGVSTINADGSFAGVGELFYRKDAVVASYEGTWNEGAPELFYARFDGYFYSHMNKTIFMFGSKIDARIENNRIVFNASAFSEDYVNQNRLPRCLRISLPLFLDEDVMGSIKVEALGLGVKWDPFVHAGANETWEGFFTTLPNFCGKMMVNGQKWKVIGGQKKVLISNKGTSRRGVVSTIEFWKMVS